MEQFYVIVTSIAVVILIIALIFMGIIMRNTKNTVIFPANQAPCPDLWTISPDLSYCYYNGKNNGSYTSFDSTTLKDSSSNQIKSSNTPFPFVSVTGKNTVIPSTFNPQWKTNDFNRGVTPICSQNLWATQNNIQWTGIKEYNGC
jgi:hypothetical protein